MNPKRYSARFIEPGIISYEDVGQGTVLVSREALDRMRGSFIGRPVVNTEHVDLTPEEAFKVNSESEPQADGIVSAVTAGKDGWDWVDFLVWNEDTIRNIDERGFGVSCAYVPTKVGPRGQYHGLPFNEEVLDGEYTHLAIVPNPRYEGSQIIQNSRKELRPMKILKLLAGKKKEPASPEPVKPVQNALPQPPAAPAAPAGPQPEELNADETVVAMPDGSQVPVSELIACYQQAQGGGGAVQNELGPEDMVEVDGQQVKVSDLMAAYEARKANAEPPTDTKAEPVVDPANQRNNAKPAAPNDKFQVIRNAANRQEPVDPQVDTRADRLERGASRYGKTVPAGK